MQSESVAHSFTTERFIAEQKSPLVLQKPALGVPPTSAHKVLPKFSHDVVVIIGFAPISFPCRHARQHVSHSARYQASIARGEQQGSRDSHTEQANVTHAHRSSKDTGMIRATA